MRTPYMHAALIGLAAAVVGVLLTVGLLHLWADHQHYHADDILLHQPAQRPAP